MALDSGMEDGMDGMRNERHAGLAPPLVSYVHVNDPTPSQISISTTERRPYVCPVCFGRQVVSPGFYDGPTGTNPKSDETCRTCKGEGIVWG